MEETAQRAIAIVGVGAIMPDAPNVAAFWKNIEAGRYSISDVRPDRWDPAEYYDADPHAPDKTYSKIGGWVREAEWDPVKWHLPIPPRVAEAMDDGQKWAVACTREALIDYGWPKRPFDGARTAVILGNAMAGEKHYLTALRVFAPEYAAALQHAPSFAALPAAVQAAALAEMRAALGKGLPPITEDTMPGELSNCIAGRIANLFDFHGPNYVVDAACASAMAAFSAAVEGLTEHEYDIAITGGVDRNMGPSAFVKFCKIGALSATGTRPYADGADGFVMGEGSAIFVLKRLADAERDGDKVYAVIRGIGGSSDGKGKGITAPNPAGQRLAIARAWENAGLSPATATLVEGHGTSTKVGDVAEMESLNAVFGAHGVAPGAIALGSVKSNIGHLKAAAGAAGLLKTALAVHHKRLPPSIHFERPNPGIDFAKSPFRVNTELRDWEPEDHDHVRRAGVSAFGFGGTNFHVVLEEHVPGRLTRGTRRSVSVPAGAAPDARGVLVVGAATPEALAKKLEAARHEAEAGHAPAKDAPPDEAQIRAPQRIAVDFGDAAELVEKLKKAEKALAGGGAAAWKALRAQGIFRGSGPAGKVAFLYTGQGSQYVNMLRRLREGEPIVAETFAEADRVLLPLLGGRRLTDLVFVDPADKEAVARAEEGLKQTEITQPAVLSTDLALTRLLASRGLVPDLVMGHSLGEYGALVAAGALPFADALEAVSARGREMASIKVEDHGWMAAITAPLPEVRRILAGVSGYVVIANINSLTQSVIGGASKAVEEAMQAFQAAGYNAVRLPVSHAFHTSIVAPASEPLGRVLARLGLESPKIPIVANVTGELYPTERPAMLDLLSRQVASPVEFVKGLETLYASGARVFVEVGPKKALHGFVEDVLGGKGDVSALFTNHPKLDDRVALSQAIAGLYAAGVAPRREARSVELGGARMETATAPAPRAEAPLAAHPAPVITGAALGLPGTPQVFDDENVARILRGEQLIDVVPSRFRKAMLDKHVTRLVKGEDGSAAFETLRHPDEVIRLAARAGRFDLEAEYGVSADRIPALDVVTRLAIAAGLDALRDAGIPLVMRYRTTSKGTQLPDRFCLPAALADDTGVIFASAFPGYDSLAEDMDRYHKDRSRRERLALLESLADRAGAGSALADELTREAEDLRAEIEASPYVFDRRFLFRILAMGHSQFAELIGARGPNTQVNSACASTTQAVALADDWIRAGRCRRVVVVGADDVTSDNLLEWIGAGFLVSGAAATDDVVEDAALPFDRRRHGMLLGMGAAGLVVESPEAVRERGLAPICEVVSAVTANSAFHGTRLDVEHIGQVMERLVAAAEARAGVRRGEMAGALAFVSHETYTPARGGSASAEVHALRHVFGADADRIVMANTKGFTGHPMGVGIEDVIAVKMLETGLVPPVANFKEVDPELGRLNLSRGGAYPIRWVLRLAAGFGSQISMALMRWTPPQDGAHRRPSALGHAYRVADPAAYEAWLAKISGTATPELEVVHRTLRIKAAHAAGTVAAKPAVPPVAAKPVAPPPVAAKPAVPAPVAPAPKPVAPPPVVEAPVAAPPTAAKPGVDPVMARVMEIIAEKTGYPSDMLDADLDLEADLGIDTVKQAETFAAVRAAYDIPRDEKLRLRDFPTLARVVQFVYDHRPDLAQAKAAPAPAAAPAAPAPAAQAAPVVEAAPAAAASEDDPVKAKVLAIIAEKTGYPSDMLDMDLDLEADLGIDTVKQAETFAAVRAAYDIPRDEKLRLRDFPTLARVVQFVYDHRPDLARSKQAPAPPAVAAPAAPLAAAPAAPAASAPPAEPAPAPVAAPADDPVKATVLAIVAEKTGYPSDMLDMDLDLEADLGIDTVKQAETFAAVRAAYDIPREEKLRLRDFPTLARVVQFVYDHRPDLAQAKAAPAPAPAATPAPAPEAAPAPAPAARPPLASLEAADRVPRRVAVPVLRPALDRCKATSVTLGAGSRVVVMLDEGGVGEALLGALGALGVETLAVVAAPEPEDLLQKIAEFAAAGPVHGVYWLPALDPEPAIAELDLAGWRAALRVRVKLLAHAMRALYAQIAGPGTFLVSATRLGGCHGYDDAGATAPMGGAVSGFTKAFAREREGALVKVVDFAAGHDPASVAALLIEETRRDPGALEIGYQGGERWSVGLVERPAADGRPGMTLGKDSVFVVTGAAGSIVAAIVADLAAASGGAFHLLDLAPAPSADDPDLVRYERGDREALKRDLFERQKARGERATPAMIEKQMAALERAATALSAIRAAEAAGGVARYHQVDLRDAAAVARAVEAVRAEHGRVDVLLHAAGLEISRFLPDKDQREYDLVFDVKADGWHNLLHAIGDMPLGAAVVFSSIAGRFGNGGQTDYSAANDLLCKMIAGFRATRPATRGIAIDWTAWAGIGMASRGSIPRMMEAAGIDMLPPEVGIPVIRRELTAGGTRGEIVVGGRLGALLRDRDPQGGVDPERIAPAKRGPMIGAVIGVSPTAGVTAEITLDPAAQPFLHDHRIDGTPVLPGVMGLEAFAEAASVAAPGWHVVALEDVSFDAPFKIYRDEPRRAVITALPYREGDALLVDCRLVGSRTIAGRAEPQETVHFTGKVRLARGAPPERQAAMPRFDRAPDMDREAIYRFYFHGPAYQVLDRVWTDGDAALGRMPATLPPNHAPEGAPTVLDPRLVELCFQTAGIWEMRKSGRFALPRRIDRVDLVGAPEPGGRVQAVTRADGDGFEAEAVDDQGRVIVALRGYRTIPLPAGAGQQ
jgi:acyl transferase domain-containing protein